MIDTAVTFTTPAALPQATGMKFWEIATEFHAVGAKTYQFETVLDGDQDQILAAAESAIALVKGIVFDAGFRPTVIGVSASLSKEVETP